MFNLCLLTSQISKVWRHGFYKRERASHESLDTTSGSHRSWLLLLLIPVVYYLCSHLLQKPHINEIQYYVPAETMDGLKSDNRVKKSSTQAITKSFPVCVLNKSQVGNNTIYKHIYDEDDNVLLNLTEVEELMTERYPLVKVGGYYSPPDCHSRHKVCILVPYRDRSMHLAVFLYNIHPFLMKQNLEYRILVIEQFGKEKFNLGRLYNAGFKEMQKYGKWKCVVFHDVDLLPMDERILYTCPSFPRHMCGTVVEQTPDPSFISLFGGVSSMTLKQFEMANGYSNLYWGWGGEDHDLYWRIWGSGLRVVEYDKSIARYTSLGHPVQRKNKYRYKLLRNARARRKDEGLSTVEYTIISVTMHNFHTHIVVDVNPNNEST